MNMNFFIKTIIIIPTKINVFGTQRGERGCAVARRLRWRPAAHAESGHANRGWLILGIFIYINTYIYIAWYLYFSYLRFIFLWNWARGPRRQRAFIYLYYNFISFYCIYIYIYIYRLRCSRTLRGAWSTSTPSSTSSPARWRAGYLIHHHYCTFIVFILLSFLDKHTCQGQICCCRRRRRRRCCCCHCCCDSVAAGAGGAVVA